MKMNGNNCESNENEWSKKIEKIHLMWQKKNIIVINYFVWYHNSGKVGHGIYKLRLIQLE